MLFSLRLSNNVQQIENVKYFRTADRKYIAINCHPLQDTVWLGDHSSVFMLSILDKIKEHFNSVIQSIVIRHCPK